MNNKMFCFQCQETAGNKGCTLQGVCGKKPEVAQLQDLLVWTTKGLCAVTSRLRDESKTIDKETNHLITQNLFITITNANFDSSAITRAIEKTLAVKETLLSELDNKTKLPDAAAWTGDKETFSTKAATVGILSTMDIDEDIRSLRELITYGLKGLAAYMKHANALLFDDPELDAFLQRTLASTLDDALALALAEGYLADKACACRVHGGGFAGTIQAFVPNDILADYKNAMEGIFGEGSCYVLIIRPVGGVEV